jgi:hypothetical protein
MKIIFKRHGSAAMPCQRKAINLIKIYYLELLLASEGTLSRWSRLRLQSLAFPLHSHGGLTIARRPVVKIIDEFVPQHNEKHVVPTPRNGIRIERRRRTYIV